MMYTDTTVELLERYAAPHAGTLDAAERRARTAVSARRIRSARGYRRRMHSMQPT
jgi:hypothetical protein